MPNRLDPGRLPPLDLLVGFEAVARRLSFTLAAKERFLTQSAISRQVKALEDDLGVPLFVRGHRSLALTADGQRLYRSCNALLEQLRGTVAHIRQRDRREVLALTTTPGLASLWLIPRLPQFARAHPGIDVRIDAELKARDLERDGFDLAIRYLALAGQGVALGRRPLVDALLRSRRLLAPFAGERASERGYALVLSPASSQRPAVQALVQWLRQQACGSSRSAAAKARGPAPGPVRPSAPAALRSGTRGGTAP